MFVIKWIFFRTTQELEYLFFCRAKREFFFQNLTLCYMTKTLNQIFFFPPPKSEYFFQHHWESEYFFRKKNIIPPFKLNGRSLRNITIFGGIFFKIGWNINSPHKINMKHPFWNPGGILFENGPSWTRISTRSIRILIPLLCDINNCAKISEESVNYKLHGNHYVSGRTTDPLHNTTKNAYGRITM